MLYSASLYAIGGVNPTPILSGALILPQCHGLTAKSPCITDNTDQAYNRGIKARDVTPRGKDTPKEGRKIQKESTSIRKSSTFT